ncbi:MAG: AraC family transcriptional regulator [Leptospiraceae bacterium]|nr:AraC family transcriptional regulator [Leptospiraceae bacterium]
MKDIFPYYSIGDFLNNPDLKTDFEILDFSNMNEPNVDPIHKHSFYEIIWIDKGSTVQTIDFVEYKVLSESIFFISPGQVHSFDEWKGTHGGNIFFTEDFLLFQNSNPDLILEFSFLDNENVVPFISYTKKNYKEVKKIINQLVEEKKRTDYSAIVLQSLLKVLLVEIQRKYDSLQTTKQSNKSIIQFKKFKSLLEKKFLNSWNANDYAKNLSISTHHLNSICKNLSGKTTTQLITARSILEAKRYLAFTDKKISEIAHILKFHDLTYFGKVFRSYTNLSPLEFKKTISEKYRIK